MNFIINIYKLLPSSNFDMEEIIWIGFSKAIKGVKEIEEDAQNAFDTWLSVKPHDAMANMDVNSPKDQWEDFCLYASSDINMYLCLDIDFPEDFEDKLVKEILKEQEKHKLPPLDENLIQKLSSLSNQGNLFLILEQVHSGQSKLLLETLTFRKIPFQIILKAQWERMVDGFSKEVKGLTLSPKESTFVYCGRVSAKEKVSCYGDIRKRVIPKTAHLPALKNYDNWSEIKSILWEDIK